MFMQEIKETTAYRKALRERILETSISLFSHHGIKAVKMDDIASHLGISKRTLYEVYKDKETLLFECIKVFDARKRQHLEAYADGHDVIDILLETYRMKVSEVQSFCPLFYEDILKYPELVEYIKKNNARMREGFTRFLRRGIGEGYFRPTLDFDMVHHLFEALGQYIIVNKLFNQYTLKELFVNLYLTPLRGLCTRAGVRRLDECDLELGE